MTKEQLLSPRYKVIADYPGSRYQIGDIIEESNNYEGAVFFKESVHKYPHIFRLMKWWEERNINEMPLYVIHDNGQPHKIEKWVQSAVFGRIFYDESNDKLWSNSVMPISEEEYNTYINQQQ